MTKLWKENKILMIHVVCELLVLGAIVFYFVKKTKNLQSSIDDLTARLDEQEDVLKKQGNMLRQLGTHVNKQQMTMQQYYQRKNKPPPKVMKPKKRKKTIKRPVVIEKVETDSDDESESEMHAADVHEDGEEDLDAVLLEELKDLEEADDSNYLKKD
tara:strand:- start:1074 stop:1544 length:471 start_codon:yes stop_codon:yes gene_type:complete